MKRSGRMKLLSILMAAVLVFGALPGTALAAEPEEEAGEIEALSVTESEIPESEDPKAETSEEVDAQYETDDEDEADAEIPENQVESQNMDDSESDEDIDLEDGIALLRAETAGDFEVDGGTSGTDFSYENNVLTILTGTVMTITMATSGATTTSDHITVSSDVSANLTLDGLNIDMSGNSSTSPLDLSAAGASTITLAGSNTMTAGSDRPGIYVPNGNQITFDGSGSLMVTGGDNWPGIGRNGNGNILINGGTIEAYGGSYAASIGGSSGYSGGTITITGGEVTAINTNRGAGIGGGNGGSGGVITIFDGVVTAKTSQSNSGAGIGGGNSGSGGEITINGGTITATSSEGSGAGIGGGSGGNGGTVTITDGNITVSSGSGAGIGGGSGGNGGTVTITGGNITVSSGGGADIGGGYQSSGGNITIEGGTVNATNTSSNGGACIGGGGSGGNGGTILISDGEVTAEGYGGAAIGGGTSGSGGEIIITGGEVTATNTHHGAGIGGGNGGSGGMITITGGEVTAQGYEGAGIGGGYNGSGGTIIITGGEVNATSTYRGAGIGGGYYFYYGQFATNGGTIKIQGGKVTATASSSGGAGIGGGYYGYGDIIEITGGTVIASGNQGIGSGYGTSSGANSLTIENCVIYSYKIMNLDSSKHSGIIYDGEGDGPATVYGSPEFSSDVRIPEGKTAWIEDDKTVTIADDYTFTNYGTLYQDFGSTYTKNGTYTDADDGTTYYEVKRNGVVFDSGTVSYSDKDYAEADTVMNASDTTEQGSTLISYAVKTNEGNAVDVSGLRFTMPAMPVELTDVEQDDNVYMLRYDANGGTGTLPDSVSVSKDDPGVLTIEDGSGLTKEGSCVFCGWSTSPGSGEVEYTAGDSLTLTKNMTLYAQYYEGHNYSIEKNASDEYEYVTFTWPEENNDVEHLDQITCKATFACTDCGNTVDVDCSVERITDNDHEASCTEPDDHDVRATATITNPRDGSELTATEDEIIYGVKLGHEWPDEATFDWSDDGTTCTASITCTRSGCSTTLTEELTVGDGITSEITTKADCTTDEVITYTADVTFTDENAAEGSQGVGPYTDTKAVTQADTALGHEWPDKATFDWNDDGKACTVSITCSRDGCGKTLTEELSEGNGITSEITTKADCTTDEVITYTAEVTFTDEDAAEGSQGVGPYTDSKAVTQADTALGHVWPATADFDWSDDGKTCTVSITCSRDGCGKTLTEELSEGNGITSEITTKADCTTDEVITYTAEVTFTDEDAAEGSQGVGLYTDSKAVTQADTATGHDWGWTDEEDPDGDKTTIKVFFECKNCGMKVEDDVVVVTTSEGIEVHTNLAWDELLSADDLAKLFEMYSDDEEIDITLDIAAKAEDEVPAEDTGLIDDVVNQLWNRSEIFYMDIALNLTVTHDNEEIVNESITETNQQITFTVTIPDELINAKGNTYTVIRVHDGTAEALDTTDNGDGTLTFSSDLFSTYAIAKGYMVELTAEVNGGENISKTYDGEQTVLTVETALNQEDEEATYTYQWYKDDEGIDGAIDATLVLNGDVTDSGTYSCVVTATLDNGTVITATTNGITVTIEKAGQDLSFAEDKLSKTTDGDPFTNPLTGAETDVTYTSSDESVATVDENGEITIVGPGTATIMATAAGDDNYNEATASFTLTVTEPTQLHTHKYEFVEWITDPATGDVYAEFKCECGDIIFEKADVTSEITKEPTATEDGVRTYTATVEYDGETYTTSWTEVIPALDTDTEPGPVVENPNGGTGGTKTGDTNNIMLWLMLLVAAAAIALVCMRRRNARK